MKENINEYQKASIDIVKSGIDSLKSEVANSGFFGYCNGDSVVLNTDFDIDCGGLAIYATIGIRGTAIVERDDSVGYYNDDVRQVEIFDFKAVDAETGEDYTYLFDIDAALKAVA